MSERLRVVLRPRGLLASMDLALAFVGREARVLAGPALAGLGVALLIRSAMDPSTPLLHWTVALLVTPLFERVAIALLGGRLVGADVGARSALRRALSQPLPTFAACLFPMLPLLCVLAAWSLPIGDPETTASLIVGFATMVGLVWPLALAPLVLTGVSTILEGHRLPRAMRRSTVLTGQHYGRALSLLVLGFAFRWIAVVTADFAHVFVWSFVLQLGTPTALSSGDGSSVPSLCAWIWAGMVVANFRLFEYVSARVDVDAWDLQLRFRALAARSWRRAA